MSTGMTILIILVLILMIITAIFVMKIFTLNEKLKKLKNTNQKVISLSILQDFMGVLGDNLISSSEKMNKINEYLIEKYSFKYSTIVVFNGAKYDIEASNVNEKHWDMFKQLHTKDIFMDSIKNAIPKYITVNQGEKLPYLEMEFERAKSAIFFPMYIDNIYIGYWLIEGSKSHEFDNIDTTILEVIKDNLVDIIKNMRSLKVIENLSRTDKLTGLNTYEYLYGKAQKVIDKYPISIVSLIKIINLRQIEEKVSKKTSDSVLKNVADYIKTSLGSEYILTKYVNNEFAIVFCGSDSEGVEKFLEVLKSDIEKMRIRTLGSLDEKMNGLLVAPKLNIVLTSYYKATALEQVFKNLSDYLDESVSNESSINYL